MSLVRSSVAKFLGLCARAARPTQASRHSLNLALFSLVSAMLVACGGSGDERLGVKKPTLGDAPAIEVHTSQAAINKGEIPLEELVERGETLFVASFNTLDGAGRPETTDVGPGNFRTRREFPDNFNRISGPDSNTCFACHSLPRLGGGGDNVTNVFIGADRLDFVNFDGGEGDDFETLTLRRVGNERNSVSVFGSGLIELLAREMTADLQSIRDTAVREARA